MQCKIMQRDYSDNNGQNTAPCGEISLPFSQLLTVLASVALLTFSSSSVARLQTQPSAVSSAYECTQVALDGVDEALLTRQERIALLDDSLSASIDSYSTCVSTVAQNMSGGGSGGGGGAAGQDGAGDAQGNEAQGAIESDAQDQTQGGTSPEQDAQMQPQISNNSQGVGSTSAARGVIPPKNNDKIICKLLYQEITKTQDTDMIEGLKQQYSNYKCGT